MSELFEERVQVERRRGWTKAWIVNALLLLYFLLAALFLVEGIEGESALTVYAWLALAAALAGALWTLVATSPGRVVIERTNPVLKQLARKGERPWLRTPSGIFTALLGVLTLVVGARVTDFSLRELFSAEGLGGARRIFGALMQPNLEIIGIVLAKMAETIFIAFEATLIAVPIAFVASFPTARNLVKGSAAGMASYTALRLLFNFMRSVEPIIWAIIFSVWVGIGPFAGMLALMLHSIAALAKLYSEQIENVDRGPIEAMETTGANKLQVLWYGVVPQIVLPYLSFTIYRWDINVRMATIIGLVGGGGVGTLLMQYQGLARWNEVGTIVIVIALVVWAMDYLSAKVREAIY